MFGNLFDPQAEFFVHDSMRPHWSQSGAVVFVTVALMIRFPNRCWGTLGKERLQWIELQEERLGIAPNPQVPWKVRLRNFDDKTRRLFTKHFIGSKNWSWTFVMESVLLRRDRS